MIRKVLLLSSLFFLTACQQMGPTEYGVRFRRLPTVLLGGVSTKVVHPGQMTFLMPWDSVYRFDTAVQDITWGRAAGTVADQDEPLDADGSPSQAASGESDTYVSTRALDGNEVALAVTVRYQISNQPERLVKMASEVATSDAEVRSLVVAVARADIRTFMNQLKTAEFLQKTERYSAVDKARAAMQARLEPYGIEVVAVNLNDFRFERMLKDGVVDASYQERLRDIQKLREDTERERSRIETVRTKKQQELAETQGQVNRLLAEAEGYRGQARLRADGYFTSRSNEARAILAKGQAEVKGMIEQINALAGKGGQEILKLEVVKQLLKNSPRFVVVNEGSGSQGIDVKRVDTNVLIQQLGLLESADKAPPVIPLNTPVPETDSQKTSHD